MTLLCWLLMLLRGKKRGAGWWWCVIPFSICVEGWVGIRRGEVRRAAVSASVWWLSSVASKDNALSLNQQPLAPSAHSGTAESAGVWLSARSLASSAKPVPGSILTWETQRSSKCLICAYAPWDSTSLFSKFSTTGNHHGPLAVVGDWLPAQQPPLSLHSSTAKLSSTPTSHH